MTDTIELKPKTLQNALGAVVRVGAGGRGFVVEGQGFAGSLERYVITAARCLPERPDGQRLPPAHGLFFTEERTYANQLALDRARAGAADRREQIETMLFDTSWGEVAAFASYHCQVESLHLKPWEAPPCHVNEDDDGPAGQLLRQMIALGISRWAPDPVGAIEAAKQAAT